MISIQQLNIPVRLRNFFAARWFALRLAPWFCLGCVCNLLGHPGHGYQDLSDIHGEVITLTPRQEQAAQIVCDTAAVVWLPEAITRTVRSGPKTEKEGQQRNVYKAEKEEGKPNSSTRGSRGPARLAVRVYEKDLKHIKKGMTVRLIATSFENRSFYLTPSSELQGRLTGEIETPPGFLGMREIIAYVPGRVYGGMPSSIIYPHYVFAEIWLADPQEVIAVPSVAVFSLGNKSHVYVKEEDGYYRREVSTGIRYHDYVEIMDGVYIGDAVVVRGALYLIHHR